MQLKNVSLFFSTFFMTSLSFAESGFDGFYLGASLGGQETQAEIESTTHAEWGYFIPEKSNNSFGEVANALPLPIGHYNGSSSVTDNRDSILGALRVGYGQQLWHTPLYASLEAFGNIANHKNSIRSTDGFSGIADSGLIPDVFFSNHTEVAMNDAEWGFDFRPGILLTEGTLLYGRVGAAFNELKIENNSVANRQEAVPVSPPISPIHSSDSKNVTGLRLGVGLEQLLTPHFSLTADYIYTDYGSIDTGSVGFIDSVIPDESISISTPYTSHAEAELKTQAIMLGINYYPEARESHSFTPIDVEEAEVFNGIYGGVRAGLLRTHAETNLNTQVISHEGGLDTFSTQTLSQSEDMAHDSILGGLFLGYGFLLGDSPYYLGAEIFGDAANRKVSSHHTNNVGLLPPGIGLEMTLSTETEARLNPIDWGVDLRFGRLLTSSTLFYLRTGVAFNELEVISNNQNLLTEILESRRQGTLSSLSSLNHKESHYAPGLRLGLGLEQMIYGNLAITADYIFTLYRSVDIQAIGDSGGIRGEDLIIIPNGFTNTTDVQMQSHAATLGLAYHF